MSHADVSSGGHARSLQFKKTVLREVEPEMYHPNALNLNNSSSDSEPDSREKVSSEGHL